MINLNPLELERLKLLLSGKTLTTEAQISTLDILRSRFPDLFSGLTENQLKDTKFLTTYLTNPQNKNTILNVLKKELDTSQQIELEKALEEKPVATEEVIYQQEQATTEQAAPSGQGLPPTGAATGSTPFGGMGLPTVPSISTPRIRFPQVKQQIPQAQAEGQKLFVTNSSGAIVGEKEITPTSVHAVPQGPSEFHIADKSGNIIETRSVGPTPTEPTPQTPQSRLAITDRYGNIVKDPLKPPETPKLYTQDKSGIIREHYVKSPSRFSGFKSSLKNFGSRAGVFFQRNIGKHLIGDRAINFLGKAGNTGINALSGITGLGGGQGGIFSSLGRFGKGRGRGGTGKPPVSGFSSGKKAALISGAVFFLVFMMTLMGDISGTTPTGQAAPISPGITPGTTADLDKKYDFTAFNIFKSDAVDDNLLQKYIERALASGRVKTNEQKNLLPSRAKFIRDQAQLAGLNPAIFLGYWESESGFSDYTNPDVRPGADSGCDPTNLALKTFEDSVLCAVGKSQITNSRTSQCATSKDINSSSCQAISFQQKEGVKLPVNTLTDFLNSYGSKVADPNNAKSDDIVKQTIADLGLVPAIAPTGPQLLAVSCPIPNGKITTYSYQYASTHPGTSGHCYGNYGYPCNCGGNGRRAKAIDIESSDQSVVLPTVQGKTVNWTYLQAACAGDGAYPYCRDLPDATGALLTFKGTGPELTDTWYIQFVHMDINKISVQLNNTYLSGISVGKTDYTNHLHTTIGKNIVLPLNSGMCLNKDTNTCPTDCDPGWMPSDFLCQ